MARVAMKPLATLNRPVLQTVDVVTKESTVSFRERTDVTAVPAMGVVAETMVAEEGQVLGEQGPEDATWIAPTAAAGATTEAATERWIAELRGLMWKHAGLLRDVTGLGEMRRRLDALAVTMPRGQFCRALEARNLHAVAGLIAASALGREESRGAHYRNDFPLRDRVAKHSVMQRGKLEFVA